MGQQLSSTQQRLVAKLRGQKRFQGLRTDPVSWLEVGIRLRRWALAALMVALLLIEDLLGRPNNPGFTIVMFVYIGYLVLLQWLSRDSNSPYHTPFWRFVRIQASLAFATAILAFSSSGIVALLVYLPWVVTAAIYLRPIVALRAAVEAVTLAVVTLWFTGQIHDSQFWLESALVAVGLLAASSFTVYVLQELVSEWRSRAQQLETLQEVGTAITAATGLDETLLRVFELTHNLIPFETALILGWDPSRDVLQVQGQIGYDPEFLRAQGFTFGPGEGLTGSVVSSKNSMLVPDVEQDKSVSPKYPEIGLGKLLRSFVAVPLIFRDDLVGVYELTSEQVDAFDERHLEILESLAPQIATALHNTQLQQQLLDQVDEAQCKYRELSDSYDISVTMALSGYDVEALLKTVVSRAVTLLGAHGGGIMLSYPTESKVRMVFTHNLDVMRGFECNLGEGAAGRVAESGNPMIVNDYQAWEHRVPSLTAPPFSDLRKAVIEVPLKWEGEVVGVLSVSDNDPARVFEEKDLKLLETFANQASLVIGNARRNAYRQKLIRISPDAIIRIDEAGRIQEFNEASERILGFKATEVMNDDVANYYDGGIEAARDVKRRLVEAGDEGVRDYPTSVKNKKGDSIPIEFSGMLLYDEAKRQMGSFGIMNDKRNEFELLANQVKSEGLAELERYPHDRPISSLSDLRERLSCQLEIAKRICKSRYLILFASMREAETVLPAIAWTELPDNISEHLPHFNWKKAFARRGVESDEEFLRSEAAEIAQWSVNKEWRERMTGAIRGSNSEFFRNAAYVVPLRLADNYRSVLMFGQSAARGDFASDTEFLKSINLTIATGALSWLQALHLRSRQKEAELATALIIHRTKVTLQQITGQLGIIKRKADKASIIAKSAEEGEKLISRLSSAVSRTLTSNVVEVEPEDYQFQFLPLAVFVQNCADGFVVVAKNRGIDLRIDPSIENLPYAEIDPTFLTVALGNLLDNALKYCFEGTYIRISSEYDSKIAKICVDDLGHQMPDAARANLLEPGLRWRVDVHKRPGMGLGLWEAARIVENHQGKLGFTSSPAQHPRKGAHAVRVWLEIPLRQG